MVRSDGGVTTAGNPFPGLRALFEGTGFCDTWHPVRSPSGTGTSRVGSFATVAILSWIRGADAIAVTVCEVLFSHTNSGPWVLEVALVALRPRQKKIPKSSKSFIRACLH